MIKQNIKCSSCGTGIFRVTKSETLGRLNGFIMIECLECGGVEHIRIEEEK